MTASYDAALEEGEPDARNGRDVPRSSTMRLPTGLAERFRHEASGRGYDHGALLIEILEKTLADGSLQRTLHPAGIVGGGRFKRRAAGTANHQPSESSSGEAVAFTALTSDFATFKALCSELLAPSQNRLFCAAVQAYFVDPNIPSGASNGSAVGAQGALDRDLF